MTVPSFPRRMRTRSSRALVLVAMLTVPWLGCRAQPRTERPAISAAFPEIADASLSPDGTTIAIEGFGHAGGSEDLAVGVWLFDVSTRELVAKSPSKASDFSLPDWGPGSSYIARAEGARRETLVYWAPAASVPAERLPLGSIWWLQRVWLAPALDYAVLSTIRAAHDIDDVRDMEVVAVPLREKGSRHSILRAPGYVSLLGVIADPVSPGHSLAVVVGDTFPDMVALDVGTGEVRWTVPIDPLSALFHAAVAFGKGEVLFCFEVSDEGGDPPFSTQIWLVDPTSSKMRYVCALPDGYRFLSVLKGSGSGELALFGGVTGVWQFTPSSPEKPPVKLVDTGKTVHPLGARANPAGQVEVFMYDEDAVWYCNLSTGQSELILGNATRGKSRPSVLLGQERHLLPVYEGRERYSRTAQ